MENDEGNLEKLFEIDGQPIYQDSLHAVFLSSRPQRLMATAYDNETHEATWISPSSKGGAGAIRMTMDARRLSYQTFTDRPGKHAIVFAGGTVMNSIYDWQVYQSLTKEQKQKIDNWQEETEKAGIGGATF